ncbi:MAG: rhodanese-like domain-containing protein, partial [Longimicrobiales bacterium]
HSLSGTSGSEASRREAHLLPRRIYWLAVTLAVGACSSTPLTQAQRQQVYLSSVEGVGNEFSDVATITAEGLQEVMSRPESLVLIDVRSPEERAVSMIPGAISVEEFERNPEDGSDKLVVVYCTIGVRSSQYAQAMAGKGVNVVNLEGSILGWSYHGGPLVQGGEATKRLHVYGPSWDIAAEGYETVW